MKIKAYHSDSVESAIRQARIELGEEAMLLDSRKTAPEERHLGRYEVRFGVNGEGSGASEAARVSPPVGAPEPPRAGGDLAELSRGIEEIRHMLYGHTQTIYLPAGQFLSQPALGRLYQSLTANEVDAEIAAQLLAGLTTAAERGAGQSELERALAERLKGALPAGGGIGLDASRTAAKPLIVALVGPTGVGKTTTVAKIAVQFGLQQGRSVHLISTDNFRIGAIDQLQTCAGILGLPWTAVDGAEDLAATLHGFRTKPSQAPDLVLVDTPGHAWSELHRSSGLAELLASRDDCKTHLVLSATTKPGDLRLIVEKYRHFGVSKLLFTKLDETFSFGCLLNETLRTRWPISLLGVGQRIPEDLAAATPEALAGLILGRDLRMAGHERKRA